MVIKLEQLSKRGIKEIMERSFADLNAGDSTTLVVEITQIKQDEKKYPPQWFLYYLFDGTTSIRAFGKNPNGLKVGDIVIVDLSVRIGKIFKGKPQFNYRIHSMQKIEKERIGKSHFLDKLKYREILRKSDLQTLPDGTRIKIFTKLLNLYPINGDREKFQKIIVADVENRPISLWFKKEDFYLFEALKSEEYFILKATVKTIEQNTTARFLSFELLIRGEEIYKDTSARNFFEERIRHHSKELFIYLHLWKTHISEANLGINLLILVLRSFRNDRYKEINKK
ncbi:MAG: hypothetical protein ACFFD2_05270 [Promethearchaeota archaeon]